MIGLYTRSGTRSHTRSGPANRPRIARPVSARVVPSVVAVSCGVWLNQVQSVKAVDAQGSATFGIGAIR